MERFTPDRIEVFTPFAPGRGASRPPQGLPQKED